MARQESLIQWASKNRQQISLEAKEFDWAWKMGLPLFDFEVQIFVDGFRGAGRGTALVETTALEKGIAEALERAVCASLKLSTTGVAAHTVSHSARENAILEALERFIFDWHLKNRKKLTPLKEHSIGTPLPEMRFFRMGIPLPYHALVCFLSVDDENFLGLSCDKDLSSAMDKAAIEVLRNLAAFQSDPPTFHRAVSENPDLWCCRSDFLREVVELLDEEKRDFSTAPLPTLQTEKIGISHLPTLAACPVFLERAFTGGGPA